MRTLYDCSHARVYEDRIYCDKGYDLSKSSRDGSLSIKLLNNGWRLALPVCRDCSDFESMGPQTYVEEDGVQVKTTGETANEQE